jgi:hypothetical protein
MAKTVDIKLNIDTSKSVSNVEKLDNSLDGLNNELIF